MPPRLHGLAFVVTARNLLCVAQLHGDSPARHGAYRGVCVLICTKVLSLRVTPGLSLVLRESASSINEKHSHGDSE